MALSTNYSGRTSLDISVFAGVQGAAGGNKMTFDDPLRVVAGAGKAAQQWLVRFLTRRGTVQGSPSYGTDFMSLAMTGRIRDDLSLGQAFAQASDATIRQLNENLTGSEAADEVVTSAVLLDSSSVETTRIVLRVSITTRAGDSREILAPVPTVFK